MSAIEANRYSNPARLLGIGFVYWLVFLLVLEPGNVQRFADSNQAFPFMHELVRILGAALLGMMATPMLLTLRPGCHNDSAAQQLLRLVIFVAGNGGIAFGMILASCLLAAWGFQRQRLPSVGDIYVQVIANWSLVGFGVLALAFFIGWCEQRDNAAPTRKKMMIREGRRASLVDPGAIVWIESRGNQIVIHEHDRSHLTRRALNSVLADLDATAFFRIHRRLVVSLPEIASVVALSNGDGEAHLKDGRVLPVSRRNRRGLREAWRQFHGVNL